MTCIVNLLRMIGFSFRTRNRPSRHHTCFLFNSIPSILIPIAQDYQPCKEEPHDATFRSL